MIIYTPAGAKPLVVTQDFHLNLAGQFALRWGNERFADPDPFFILHYMARNHDAGWLEFDWDPVVDPETGLAFSVEKTPLTELATIHRRNIARNYNFHPYAGLLSAMHIKGFFTSRLGMSTFLVIDKFRELYPDIVEPLIDECDANIEEWTEEVRAKPETASWVTGDRLWANYRLVQIFDQLSLYFCLGKTSQEIPFTNVPVDDTESVDIVVRPLGDDVFSLNPYPLSAIPVRVVLDARAVMPPMRSPHEDLLSAPIRQLEFELRPPE